MLDLIEIAMKAATFLGVVVTAVPLVALGPGPVAQRRLVLWGAAGVALMVGNAWIAPWGLALDVAYLGFAARAGWKALAAPPKTTFTLIAVR